MFSHIQPDQDLNFIDELAWKGVGSDCTADIRTAVGLKIDRPLYFTKRVIMYLCPRANAMKVKNIRTYAGLTIPAWNSFQVHFMKTPAKKLLRRKLERGFLLLSMTVSRHGNLVLINDIHDVHSLTVAEPTKVIDSISLVEYLREPDQFVPPVWHEYIAG